jgi:glutamate 5-kinase
MNCQSKSRKDIILSKKRIVVKVGTSSILYPDGKFKFRFIDHLARQMCDLMNRGCEVVLVTSGAIGVGFPILGFKEKPALLHEKQAAAAVGQGFLMNVYERSFQDYGRHVGQVLLTKGDSLNPKRYMYARGMIKALLSLGVVPIINENDADLLILLSDVAGLYDKNPAAHEDAKLLEEVPHFTRDLFKMAGGPGTKGGTGGMYTKLLAAEICVRSGIDMIIAESDLPNVLYRIADGESIGTFFRADSAHPQLKRREVIIGAGIDGKIFVDEGCRNAILNKGSSLLPVGIVGTDGAWSEGDIVSVYFKEEELARGIAHYGREDVERIRGAHTSDMDTRLGFPAPYDTVIHRDNLYVLH